MAAFDTGTNNFFANKPNMVPPPVGAPKKVEGVEKPQESDKPKKEENPLLKTNVFDFSKKEGKHFVMQEEAPRQERYDGHIVGDRFHSQFC